MADESNTVRAEAVRRAAMKVCGHGHPDRPPCRDCQLRVAFIVDACGLVDLAADAIWLATLCRHDDRVEPAEIGWPEMTTALDRIEAWSAAIRVVS